MKDDKIKMFWSKKRENLPPTNLTRKKFDTLFFQEENNQREKSRGGGKEKAGYIENTIKEEILT